MRIGLAQMDIVWENVEANKKKTESFFKQAGRQGVDLLIFPEMTLTGFSMNVERTTMNWEDQKEWFLHMSKTYSLAVACGIPETDREEEKEKKKEKKEEEKEKEEGKGKNPSLCTNHLLIIDQGRVIMDYAKIHPFSFGEESKHFKGGRDIFTGQLKEMTVGGFVCYDLRFPEIFQISSEKSQLILVIANWPVARIHHWDILLQARAIENQCYIAGINRVGQGGGLSYSGHSAIYGPEGERLNPLSEKEELIVVDIDSNQVRACREAFPLKMDRKEELYQHLYVKSKI